MNRVNYNKAMEEILGDFTEVKSLLLHSCCGPCSSSVIERLTEYFHIYIYYYNPNIHPEEEYIKRYREQVRIVEESEKKNPVEIVAAEYEPKEYFNAVRGYEKLPEGSARCSRCYELRMKETAEKAALMGMDYFATTLSVSPYKDAEGLNEIGMKLEREYGVRYLLSDFKKKDGYLRSIELSKEHNLYRQNYCGCIFSKEWLNEA